MNQDKWFHLDERLCRAKLNRLVRRIDGIVYGDDPRQGFVDGDAFYHPTLRFQFPIPSKWHVTNAPVYVLVVSEKQDAYVQLTLGEADSPGAEADAFVEEAGVSLIRRESGVVNGLPAELVEKVTDHVHAVPPASPRTCVMQ